MHARITPPHGLLALAEQQGGVVSRALAAEHGVGRHVLARLVAQGQWQALGRGLYLVSTTGADWSDWARAGTMIGGRGSFLGGRSAAHTYGLLAAPARIEIWVPARPLPRQGDPWNFRLDGEGRRRGPGGLPRLRVEETVLDLATTLPAGALLDVVFAALQQGLTTAQRLRVVMDGRNRLSQRELLDGVLADVSIGVESPLERVYLTRVEQAHGLPCATRQHRSDQGRYRRDVLYEDQRLVVELDGEAWHRGGRLRDMRRDNVHQLRGLPTLRYGWHDVVQRACDVADEVAWLLVQQGWPGRLRRCARCS